MQQLRSFALPTPPTDVHDYAHLQDHLIRGISPRLIAFFILSIAPLSGFLHPPTPIIILKPPPPPPQAATPAPPSSLLSLQIFFFFNSLALMSCVTGLLVSISHFLSASSNNSYASLVLQRKRLAEGLSKTAGGLACLVCVCISLAAAYPFAGLTVAGESKSLRYAVLVPSLIGGLLLVEALLFLIRHFFRWWASFMPDHHLWRAIQQHTLFGSFLAKFL